MSDSLGKLSTMLVLAKAHGCALLVPPPSVMLEPKHNGGTPVAESVWWDRYVKVPGHMLRELPKSLVPHQAGKIVDSVPSIEYLRNISQGQPGGRATTLISLEYSYNDFWETGLDIPGKAMDALPPGAEWEKMKWATSTLIEEKTALVKSQFAKGELFGLQLRRGDKMRQYPAHCSDVPAVLTAIKRKRKKRDECRSTTTLFVATNEHNQMYINELRSGLEQIFEHVYFEADMPQLKFNDNFLTYLVDQSTIWSAKCGVRFHPRDRQLMARVCPMGLEVVGDLESKAVNAKREARRKQGDFEKKARREARRKQAEAEKQEEDARRKRRGLRQQHRETFSGQDGAALYTSPLLHEVMEFKSSHHDDSFI